MTMESDEIRGLISRASKEAAAIGNDYIGAAHLLLALIADRTSPAVRVLEDQGVQPAELRERCVKQMSREESISPGDVTELTSRARASIQHAAAEAARHDVQNARDVDVLVGLIAQPESIAAQVLREAGLTYDALHQAVYSPESSRRDAGP